MSHKSEAVIAEQARSLALIRVLETAIKRREDALRALGDEPGVPTTRVAGGGTPIGRLALEPYTDQALAKEGLESLELHNARVDMTDLLPLDAVRLDAGPTSSEDWAPDGRLESSADAASRPACFEYSTRMLPTRAMQRSDRLARPSSHNVGKAVGSIDSDTAVADTHLNATDSDTASFYHDPDDGHAPYPPDESGLSDTTSYDYDDEGAAGAGARATSGLGI